MTSQEAIAEILRAIDSAQTALERNGNGLAAILLRRAITATREAQNVLREDRP